MDEKTVDWFLTQGALGVAVLLLIGALIYVYRESKAARKQYDEDLSQERDKHAIEIAAERKLNLELQEKRYTELRAGFSEVSKALATVDQALMILHGSKQ